MSPDLCFERVIAAPPDRASRMPSRASRASSTTRSTMSPSVLYMSALVHDMTDSVTG
jgi:hypothetical protein